MKIFTVLGARPQFIKAAPMSKALHNDGHLEYLVHTGQHYDHVMSQIFFDELGIPAPSINLGIGSGTHGWQTGQMLQQIEELLEIERPDCVLLYGDTNSTLAGALAAVKLHFPVAHVEAGLRSFNRLMPEEHNRVLTDHCADLLFCPTQTAVTNLRTEGLVNGVHWVGDTMYDAVLQFADLAVQRSTVLHDLGLSSKKYLLATIHRPYNTDNPEKMKSILTAFRALGEPVIFPIHPRTRRRLNESLLSLSNDKGNDVVRVIEPIGYLDMLQLEQHARCILTDSGGVQKEAYFFGVPCITLRTETEWVETVDAGWNTIVGTEKDKILAAVARADDCTGMPPPFFGDGNAAMKIVDIIAHT